MNDKKTICDNCYYNDINPEYCHAMEPPIKKPFIPENISDCYYIPISYWNRMPDERKKEFEKERKGRSKRYYMNKKK